MSRSLSWTGEEENVLKSMYLNGDSVKKICESIGRSERAIANKAYKMKLGKNVNFTEEEIAYIKENYLTMNIKELAENIGRGKNWQNVCRKAKEFGLTGGNVKVKHKDRPEPIVRLNKYNSDEERSEAHSKMMIEWHSKNEHPRGMKGKTHTKEYKKRQSLIMKDNWRNPDHPFNSEENKIKSSERMSKMMVERIKKNSGNNYSRGKGGIRKDLGIYFRSKWEANVARYLNLLIEESYIYKWEYEVDTFHFDSGVGETKSYTPDFKIFENKDQEYYYIEVKGYMDKRSREKLDMMEKYHPSENVLLLCEKEYKEIKKNKNLIKNFE